MLDDWSACRQTGTRAEVNDEKQLVSVKIIGLEQLVTRNRAQRRDREKCG